MKPFDNNDLIAYHLHELSSRRARALERALDTDTFLAAESEAYAATLRGFKSDTPLAVDEEVIARNWTALLPALPVYRVPATTPSRWRMPVLAGAGLAFAATAFFVVTHRHDAGSVPRTASVGRPSDVARSVPAVENSLSVHVQDMSAQSGGARIFDERGEESGGASEEGHAAAPSRRPPANGLLDSRPPKVAYLPYTSETAATVHFIPLAPVPLPSLPAPRSLPITFAPAGSGQAVAPSVPLPLKHGHASFRHEHPPELTLAMGGTFIGTRETSGPNQATYSEGATHAVSAIAAFHQQLRRFIGYRVTFSYTKPDFLYGFSTPSSTEGVEGISGRTLEIAATYVVEGPHRGRLSTSVEGGAALVNFRPPRDTAGLSFRPAAVAGVAADYAITKHLALHAAYRAQVFHGPAFDSGVPVPSDAPLLFSNEPSMGITYRFFRR